MGDRETLIYKGRTTGRLIVTDRCAHFNRPMGTDGKPLPPGLLTSKPCPRCGLPIVSIRGDLLA